MGIVRRHPSALFDATIEFNDILFWPRSWDCLTNFEKAKFCEYRNYQNLDYMNIDHVREEYEKERARVLNIRPVDIFNKDVGLTD